MLMSVNEACNMANNYYRLFDEDIEHILSILIK